MKKQHHLFIYFFIFILFISSSFAQVKLEESTEQRTIVTTGSTGHLGIVLLEKILLENPDVTLIATYKDDESRITNLKKRWAYLAQNGKVEYESLHERMKTEKANVLNIHELREAFRGADSIVHMAAVIALGKYQFEKREAMRQVNLEGTKNVLQVAREMRIKNFVHISTSHVLHHHKDRPLSRNDGIVSPKGNTYDALKARAHLEVKKSKEFKTILFMPTGIIGRDDHEETEMIPIFERYPVVRFGPIPEASYAFVDVRQLASVVAEGEKMLATDQIKSGKEFLVPGQFVDMKTFISELQNVTGLGHCLNWPIDGSPVTINHSFLQWLAPWIEWGCYLVGIDSPLKEYNLSVLDSVPGVCERDLEKLERFFGDKAKQVPLSETFIDREEVKELQLQLD